MGGIRGIVIKLDFKEIEIIGETIEAGAGVLLSRIANIACENELARTRICLPEYQERLVEQ